MPSKNEPSFELETAAGGLVCGVDEVGRGPLAGPVVAAAVILKTPIDGLNDSKKLSKPRREALATRIRAEALWALGEASVAEIDRLNILQAALLAMRRAVEALPERPDLALIDGNRAPRLFCPAHPVIRGDQISTSIAAASIVAKVYRDGLMRALAQDYPGYGWDRNAGYGTKPHREAILELGLTPHHRKTFTAKLQENRIVA